MSNSQETYLHHDRYSRQIRFQPLGREGHECLAAGKVLLVGVGALGTVTAEILARAGVGFLRLVDRDFVDLSNLQRQSLFDERDAREGTPKAIAARNRLRQINSEISIESIVADVTPRNVVEFSRDVDLILDGTDNFEIRFLLNDLAVREGKPWIYTGCLGSDGQMLVVHPGSTPCLRCLMPLGPPGTIDTCDTAGVLGPIVYTMAAWQAMEAIKILSHNDHAVAAGLHVVSLWNHRTRVLPLDRLRDENKCPTCFARRFEWLEGNRFSETIRLCGRKSIQINPGDSQQRDLAKLAERIAAAGLSIQCNPYYVRFVIDPQRITVFADGRAIIEGTDDTTLARALYTRFVGT